jgi:hypothetical protein
MSDFLVCKLVSDGLPAVASRVVPCSECGRDLWRALSSPREPLAICMACTGQKIGPQDEIFLPTQDQIDDIHGHGRN